MSCRIRLRKSAMYGVVVSSSMGFRVERIRLGCRRIDEPGSRCPSFGGLGEGAGGRYGRTQQCVVWAGPGVGEHGI
jgi:hypothetical protein